MTKKILSIGLAVAVLAIGAAFVAPDALAVPAQSFVNPHVIMAMAVIAAYGTGARNPSSLTAIDGILAAAEIRQINSVIAFAVGDSTNSTRVVGELPADAILDPLSSYIFGATGITDLDVGFAYPNGGAVIDADNLVDGDDVSSAGSQTLFGHGTLTLANANKRVWELAGLSSNPGGNLAIITTQKAGTAAAANILFNIRYSKGA